MAVTGSQRTCCQPVGLLQRERGGRRGCPETSVTNYQSMARKTSEERSSQNQRFYQIICSRILQVGGLTCRWQRNSVKPSCWECSMTVEQAETQLRVVVPKQKKNLLQNSSFQSGIKTRISRTKANLIRVGLHVIYCKYFAKFRNIAVGLQYWLLQDFSDDYRSFKSTQKWLISSELRCLSILKIRRKQSVSFQLFTAVVVQMKVFWVLTPHYLT
jgi:hypothetical protein